MKNKKENYNDYLDFELKTPKKKVLQTLKPRILLKQTLNRVQRTENGKNGEVGSERKRGKDEEKVTILKAFYLFLLSTL